jgi:hypothetical protein
LEMYDTGRLIATQGRGCPNYDEDDCHDGL